MTAPLTAEELDEALERASRVRGYAQDCLDNGHIPSGGGAIGNLMSIRDEIDAISDLIRSARALRPGAGIGGEPHPDTVDLVNRFSAALAAKLRRAEEKYGYSNGWASQDWQADCQVELARHVAKGDPLDVAAYAAFCFHHGWSTAAPTAPDCKGWEAIETAPKDGTRVLLVCMTAYTPTVYEGWWGWWSNAEGWHAFSLPEGKDPGGVITWFPTHWAPLPAPPHTEGEGS